MSCITHKCQNIRYMHLDKLGNNLHVHSVMGDARFSELGWSRSSGCRSATATPNSPFTHPKKLGFAQISWVILLEAEMVRTPGPPFRPPPPLHSVKYHHYFVICWHFSNCCCLPCDAVCLLLDVPTMWRTIWQKDNWDEGFYNFLILPITICSACRHLPANRNQCNK